MLNYPVVIATRGTQIKLNHELKSTGSNSLYGFAMQGVGPVVRIVTTIVQIGFDLPLLAGYSMGVVLNGALVIQCVWRERGERSGRSERGGRSERNSVLSGRRASAAEAG
jgi:hypothetical protein